jgi:hypothetical protein
MDISHDIEEYLPGAWHDPHTQNGFDYPEFDAVEYAYFAEILGMAVVV